jgi:AcrR family transcriptional regulator
MTRSDGTRADAPRRRRGAELEAALLRAAWDELVEVGYARMTMDSVAKRARTSEPVLYRRWANKDQLVLAAIERFRIDNPIDAPDTGTLRTDLIAQLTIVSEALAGFYAIASATAISGVLSGSGLSLAEARAQVMAAQDLPPVRTVYQRAADRGELDLDRTPSIVLDLPFDMVRHDMLMNVGPADPERIRQIVDDLFLPLIEQTRR